MNAYAKEISDRKKIRREIAGMYWSIRKAFGPSMARKATIEEILDAPFKPTKENFLREAKDLMDYAEEPSYVDSWDGVSRAITANKEDARLQAHFYEKCAEIAE